MTEVLKKDIRPSEYAEKALIETVMRPELDSAEFEIESSLCTSNSSQKRQQVSDLWPRPTENKIAGYFSLMFCSYPDH